MKDLSIIILNYNTAAFLRNCLASIADAGIQNLTYEVIIVDNASTDDSVAIVKKEFPAVTLIVNEKNLGFSAGNNVGVRKASGRYVLFLNSDTLLEKNTLETLVSFMDQRKDAGAATCFVRLPDGRLDDAAHRGFPTPLNAFFHFSKIASLFPRSTFFNGYHMGWCRLSETHTIDALAGAFMLVRREAGEQAGWWDEDYFFYGEDLDFCYELKQKGWHIYFVPSVTILHYKGVSGGLKEISQKITTASDATKKRSKKARFDAMRIFYQKHYMKQYPKIVTWLVFQGIALRSKF
jgi:GT2 family glycosyltransferase